MQRHQAPFRADIVGRFLRPDAIKQARLQLAEGTIDAGHLREIENEAIRQLVQQQCDCGLHVVTDGEFRRAWWHFDFFDGLEGVERYDSEKGIQFNGVQTDQFTLNKAGDSTSETDINSVSGASTSSGAIVNAVNAALDFYAANVK